MGVSRRQNCSKEDTVGKDRCKKCGAYVSPHPPKRERLPDERDGTTHKFSVGGHEGYITVNTYPDGRPGEIFIVMAKEGSTISGLMDVLAMSVSIGLQYGVPIEAFIAMWKHTRFEPSGQTGNPEIQTAQSIADYLARWLSERFLKTEIEEEDLHSVDSLAGNT